MRKIRIAYLLAILLPVASYAQVVGGGPVIGGGGSGGSGTIGGTLGATDDLAVCTDGTGGSTIGACTVLNIDNVRVDGNTISSTDTNGAIALVPNGTGAVGVGVTDPSRKFGVDGRAVIGDGNIGNFDKQGVLDVYLGTALVGFLASPTRWSAIVTSAPNGTTDSLAIGHINGVGPFIEAHSGMPLVVMTGGSEFATFGTDHVLTLTGWANTYGKNALTADYTNATATMSNLTALSTTLIAARKYTFRMVLRFSNSTAADGIMVDFDGGTATATDFGVNCQVYDTALLLSQDATALATDIVATTTTGASKMICDGSFTVNAAGTFIPRAAEEADGGGTLTVELGSHLLMEDVSFN